MTRLNTELAWYDYQKDGDNVLITLWPTPIAMAASKVYPACTCLPRSRAIAHYLETKALAI